ncbi:MAG: ribonuclease BN [Burkholderiales bacterium RIFCSPLOWO2_12_FULL_61_40]|nr:MAG: ribonuclease BN [Burkholderiales bacterium RIFCSPLOWO2_12_FULL_61_40]
MTGIVAEWLGRLDAHIWGAPNLSDAPWQTHGLRLVRTVLVLVRDLTQGQLTLRAMSLVYTTLLSIVPLFALSFSVLKAFGAYNQIEPMLLTFLEPLGERGLEVAQRITQFIESINVGVLGALGLMFLIYTTISLMQKIEESLNFIWHVPYTRPLGERFSRYLSVLLIGPILVFSALGITASVMNLDLVRQLLALDTLSLAVQAIGQLTPYLLVISAFTFVYLFIPNTHVRWGPALIGGVVGGIVWQTSGWLFAAFVVSSGNYAAIYSSFAILVLFMIWLYVSWLVLLFGASVAFYVQHPEYLYRSIGEPRLSNRVRERLALSIMSLMAGRFVAGERALSLGEFTHLLGVPTHVLSRVFNELQGCELVAQSADDPPLYFPARDLSLISVGQILNAVRAAGEARFFSPYELPTPTPVKQVLEKMHSAIESAVGAISLRELADPGASRAGPDSAGSGNH